MSPTLSVKLVSSAPLAPNITQKPPFNPRKTLTMVVSRSTFFSLSALAAASVAHASLKNPPPVYDRGAERVGDANWNKAFDLNLGGPNATSRFATFKGYDLSKPYLESESAHQWSYTVQVKDGIPLEGQEAADPEKAEFVTGTQISLWPERNVTVNNEWATPLNYSRTTGALSAEEVQARSSGGVHPSWNICQMMFTSYTLWHTEPVNAYYPHVPATPDCGNFLDSDCAQALKISLANEFNTNGTARGVNLTGIDRCPRTDMNLPESCKPKFGQVEHVPDKEFAQYSATAVCKYTLPPPATNPVLTKPQ